MKSTNQQTNYAYLLNNEILLNSAWSLQKEKMMKRNMLLVMLVASTVFFSLTSCSSKAKVLVTVYSTQMDRNFVLRNPKKIGTETLEVGDVFTAEMTYKWLEKVEFPDWTVNGRFTPGDTLVSYDPQISYDCLGITSDISMCLYYNP